MTDNINWQQKRQVFFDSESGEYWVKVPMGFMLDSDYIDGGTVEAPFRMADKKLEDLGKFTNAQINRGDYIK